MVAISANPNRSFSISVVVPVHDNRNDLDECLSALQASPGCEVIVVDDASTDASAEVAAARNVQVLSLRDNSGPAAARNHGARHARGEVLVFVDADVVVAEGAIERATKALEDDPAIAAVFGSYDACPRAGGLVSQYRNLLHHFVHQNGNREASTFWAACGAIRRSVFDGVGGFDEKRYRRSSIEDIELGYRVREAGYRILLDKDVHATHLKRWTLLSMIKTDVARRAVPWSRLILERGTFPDDLNLRRAQRLSIALTMLGSLCLLLSAFRLELLAVVAAAVAGVLVVNRELFAFFVRSRSLRFAAACVPLHLLHYLCSGVSYLYVRSTWQLGVRGPLRRRQLQAQRG